ncbi:MAG TPA: L-seryl-tRNA(Sec) selenium transferase [Thermodesulfovibrionales bacterium]|nr:L-seryl-tRNA(Sec) selenium transferase [Thermodesulfovibrionales bacterium]
MVEKYMRVKQKMLADLPSVDEILKSGQGVDWLKEFPRKFVLQAVREAIDCRRKGILEGSETDLSPEGMTPDIEANIKRLSSYSLKPLINATGVVIHTNLGRSILSDKIVENIKRVSASYSNLEYDIDEGKRGKRYTHVKRILRETTGAEDALIVNNNAAAVLLCLNALAKGREVIVSRGELVEIGGSFRVPDVMAASGAILREVGTTNKTHLFDYEKAINENTALILKVHKSNYRIVGFSEEVSIEDLARLGKKRQIPVMFDLGSGCLMDLRPYGIHDEPSVRDIVKTGVDITTFSGDKLLGGPQGGVIVGKKESIGRIQKNPITRAVRIDKLTLAGFEATLMEYVDEERAVENIPTLRMLLQRPEVIRKRANILAAKLKRHIPGAVIKVVTDTSRAGGGSLPEMDLPTYAISVKPANITVNELEEKLRKGSPAIIARIKDDSLLFDARTLQEKDFGDILRRISSIIQ